MMLILLLKLKLEKLWFGPGGKASVYEWKNINRYNPSMANLL